ncbi:MAG: DNA repair protein RecN, partial [Aquificaceae bacterium]
YTNYMLIRINLQDFFLIKEEEVEFGPSLNALTGESGTGKSLTVSSMLFLMGRQRDYPDGTCVEATFLDGGEELVVRREVSKGKSKYYVNGKGSVQKVVKDIVSRMVLLQGQNDRLKVLRKDFQRDVYDKFCGVLDKRREYEKLYSKLESLKEELKNLHQLERERGIRLKLLQEELRDVESVGLSWEDYEEIKDKLDRLSHAERINSIIGKAISHIENDEGVLSKIGEIKKATQQLCQYDKSVEDLLKNVESIKEEVMYIKNILRSRLLDVDLEELNRLNEKIYLTQRLERRYNMKYKEILKYAEELKAQINMLMEGQTNRELLDGEIQALEEVLKSLEETLTKSRWASRESFEGKVKGILKEVGLERASFKVDLFEEAGRYGKEGINFLFSSYGGEEKPLEHIASGGEMSRLALALFFLFPSSETYVLDEIDTGISGEISIKLAKLLKRLSKSMQVIVVTHSPAIASAADRHIVTSKGFIGNMAFVRIRELDGEERLREIARLMGVVSERTLEGARELIKEVCNV